jgi:hypothetical protein
MSESWPQATLYERTVFYAKLFSHPKPVIPAWSTILAAIIAFGIGTRFWLINHRKRQIKNKMPTWVPNPTCLMFVVIGLVFWVSAVKPELPDANVILSLAIDDFPPLALTNDYLFSFDGSVQRKRNKPIAFKGFARGCLVIPLKPGESNKVFTFLAENACERSFDKVQCGIAFPKDWKISADEKWAPACLSWFWLSLIAPVYDRGFISPRSNRALNILRL